MTFLKPLGRSWLHLQILVLMLVLLAGLLPDTSTAQEVVAPTTPENATGTGNGTDVKNATIKPIECFVCNGTEGKEDAAGYCQQKPKQAGVSTKVSCPSGFCYQRVGDLRQPFYKDARRACATAAEIACIMKYDDEKDPKFNKFCWRVDVAGHAAFDTIEKYGKCLDDPSKAQEIAAIEDADRHTSQWRSECVCNATDDGKGNPCNSGISNKKGNSGASRRAVGCGLGLMATFLVAAFPFIQKFLGRW